MDAETVTLKKKEQILVKGVSTHFVNDYKGKKKDNKNFDPD